MQCHANVLIPRCCLFTFCHFKTIVHKVFRWDLMRNTKVENIIIEELKGGEKTFQLFLKQKSEKCGINLSTLQFVVNKIQLLSRVPLLLTETQYNYTIRVATR